jgi:hypothetical protein
MSNVNRNAIVITMAEAKVLIQDILLAGLVPFIASSPGIGKSDLGQEISREWQLRFIDQRLSSADPTDMNGFPMILNHDADRVKGGYVPMEMFPVEGDKIPESCKGWLLMLDEFNSAPLTVQAAAYKVVLDKKVGMHNLHKRVAIIAAGNLQSDKAYVNKLNTAMQSRLIHLEIAVCDVAWMAWADHKVYNIKNVKSGVDHRVKSFIKFKPDALHKFDPNHTDKTFPCPRTWEFVSKLIKPWEEIHPSKLPILAGTVGVGMSRDFFSYCQIYDKIPTLKEILADPVNVSFGDEPSMQFALAGLVGQKMNFDNADPLIQFIARLGIEFQVSTLRSAIARDPGIKKAKNVRTWISSNAEEFLT